MGNVLILTEHQNGHLKKVSFELASKASELASHMGGEVQAVVIGSHVAGVSDLGKYGVKKIFTLFEASLEKYNTENYAAILSHIIQEHRPDIVLAVAGSMGKDLLPRVAARLKTGLMTDCTDLKMEGGKLVATRPIYAGKAFVDVKIPESTPQMATIRPNSFPIHERGGGAQVIPVVIPLGETRARMKEVVQGAHQGVDLTEAEVVVAGGRSLKSAENFKLLEELANVLGGAVGASRAAVDSGYVSHDIQVGQTGKTVNPKLYIACGISGAIQHLAGMRTSKVIVAINKDPEAPIFKKADYGIVEDLFRVVPLLTKELKKVLAE